MDAPDGPSPTRSSSPASSPRIPLAIQNVAPPRGPPTDSELEGSSQQLQPKFWKFRSMFLRVLRIRIRRRRAKKRESGVWLLNDQERGDVSDEDEDENENENEPEDLNESFPAAELPSPTRDRDSDPFQTPPCSPKSSTRSHSPMSMATNSPQSECSFEKRRRRRLLSRMKSLQVLGVEASAAVAGLDLQQSVTCDVTSLHNIITCHSSRAFAIFFFTSGLNLNHFLHSNDASLEHLLKSPSSCGSESQTFVGPWCAQRD